MKGIVDRERKIKLLHLLLHTKTVDQLMYELAKQIDDTSIAENFATSLPTWNRSDPTGPTGQMFLMAASKVLEKVTNDLAASEELFWKARIEDILERFPDDVYKRVAPSLELGSRDKREWTIINFWEAAQFISAEDGVRRGRLDFRMCYMVPDAAKSWRRVTKNGFYGQYYFCQSCLETLLDSSEWKKFVQSKSVLGAVSLGAGSASKDYRILNSLKELATNEGGKPYLSVVDCSPYMLRDTGEDLRKFVGDTADVNLLCMDFLELRKSELLRRRDTIIAWFCNGGTLGNVHEGNFFSSIAGVAEPGDRLFFSVETLPRFTDEDAKNEFQSVLEKKYSQPEIQSILESPLRDAFPFLIRNGLSGDLDPSMIRVRMVPGKKRQHSDIPGSLTAELFVETSNGDVVLFASTRYDQEKLIDFAADYGLRYLYDISSPLHDDYKFLSFEVVED